MAANSTTLRPVFKETRGNNLLQTKMKEASSKGSKTLGVKSHEAPVETTWGKPRPLCGLVLPFHGRSEILEILIRVQVLKQT